MGKVEYISCGLVSNGALSSEGRMFLWGVMNEKYIDEPTQIDMKNVISLALGGSSNYFAVNSKGELYQILDFEQGKYFRMKRIENIPSIKSINCGVDHVIALTEHRTLYGWGSNKYGQITDGDKNMPYIQSPVLIEHLNSVNKVVCGSYHTVILSPKSVQTASLSSNSISSSVDVPDEAPDLNPKK